MAAETKITVLPPEVSNKIAAGEVVERPASVVKELVENSIDAGADDITILLKDGGKELIRIVDNGCGMSEADVRLAFQRHATSKIAVAEDLEAISTLGFRGEALASIASVSQIEIKSIPSGEDSGLEVHLEGGYVIAEKPAGGTTGTSIAVKNLFFNTPGRRKFLKATSTEYRRCLVTANRFALCYPSKAFRLIHNDKVIWDVPPQSLKERTLAILGKRLANMLIEIEADEGAIAVHGLVGTHESIRKVSGEQYFFLNGRFFTDRSLNHAVTAAYGEILAHGGYPLYILHLTVDPTRVDVNVHPTKMQVKFADDRLVYSLLRSVIRRHLMSSEVIPNLDKPATPLEQRLSGNWRTDTGASAPSLLSSAGDLLRPSVRKQDFYTTQRQSQSVDDQLRFDIVGAGQEHASPDPGEDSQPDHRDESEQTTAFAVDNVFQIHNRYILSQTSQGLVIIDQHAAHERIMYEKALALFEAGQAGSQKLLFPKMLEVSAEDFEILKEMRPFLEKIGFVLDEFGHNTIVLEGVPSGLRIKDYDRILQQMIDDYRRGKRNNLEIRDNIAKTWSCHGSIRSGDRLTPAEMNALIEQLFQAETPYFCPHGRPVIITITTEELDNRFGRT